MHPNNCPNCSGPAKIYIGPFKDHPVYQHPIYTRPRGTSQMELDDMADLTPSNSVYCDVCLIFTYEYHNLEDAIDSWNTPHSLQIMHLDGTNDWGPNPPMLIRVSTNLVDDE